MKRAEGLGPRGFDPELWQAPPLESESLRSLLASSAPLDLEIGCGVGLHPIRYAISEPGRTLLAIEKTREKFAKFQRRLDRHAHLLYGPGKGGIVPLHADAVAWVARHIPEERLERVFILYPNPSFRNPAARWIRMPFFGFLLTRVKRGGEILFRTNEKRYAEEVLFYADHLWGGEREDLHREISEFTSQDVPLGEAWTHFEAKYLERGQTCFQVLLVKKECPE